MRILVSYKTIDNTYVAGYFLSKAFKDLGYEVDNAPIVKEYDLCVYFDPLVSHTNWGTTFYWEIDSNRKKGLEIGCDYDLLFIAGKDFEYYPEAIWLPPAAEPSVHRRIGKPIYDIANIGQLDKESPVEGYRQRALLFEIAHDKGYSIYHTDKRFLYDEYPKELSKGKLLLNRPGLMDMNMRFFESMAVGCMLWYPVGDYTELATPGIHYVPFRNDDEFLDALEKYTKDDKARNEIERSARELILNKHTYKHRALEMLSYL